MARNIEIKARVADPEELRARIAMLAGSDAERLIQRDTFFEVPSGRLKLREFSDRSAELIFYERSNQAGPRRSSYTRSAVPEPASPLPDLPAVLSTSLAATREPAKTYPFASPR